MTGNVDKVRSLVVAICIVCGSARVLAGTLYESAAMGPPGQLGGTTLMHDQYAGARFYISQSSLVSRVGGHMGCDTPSHTFFAAIVRLDGPTALPHGDPFTTGELVAVTNFSMGAAGWPSLDWMTPLSVALDPGWYGLVFGGGRYSEPFHGAYGSGFMPANNANLPGSTYFGWTSPYLEPTNVWKNGIASECRFVVEGSAVTSQPRICSVRFANNRMLVTLTNLLWGYETGVEARNGQREAPWTDVTNAAFVATNSCSSCSTVISNMGNAGLIRMIQR